MNLGWGLRFGIEVSGSGYQGPGGYLKPGGARKRSHIRCEWMSYRIRSVPRQIRPVPYQSFGMDSGLRVSACGFWVSGSGFRVPGSGFRVLGSVFRVPDFDFGFWISEFGFRGSGFGFRIPGSGFRVPGSRFRILGSRFRGSDSDAGFLISGFGVRVSGFGFRGSGSRSRVSGFGLVRRRCCGCVGSCTWRIARRREAPLLRTGMQTAKDTSISTFT